MLASFLYFWILKKLHTNIAPKPLSALQSVSSLIIFNWWAPELDNQKKMDGWSSFYSISSTLCHSVNFLMWLSSKYFAFTRIRLVLISHHKRVNINKTVYLKPLKAAFVSGVSEHSTSRCYRCGSVWLSHCTLRNVIVRLYFSIFLFSEGRLWLCAICWRLKTKLFRGVDVKTRLVLCNPIGSQPALFSCHQLLFFFF